MLNTVLSLNNRTISKFIRINFSEQNETLMCYNPEGVLELERARGS